MSKSRRHSVDTMEAAVKAGLAVLLLVALGIGGLGGFAAVFTALVMLLVLVGIFGLFSFLVLRSRLYPAKKTGLILIAGASFLGIIWGLTKPPDQWMEEKATVASLTLPTISVTATYHYEVGHQTLDYTSRRDWKNLAEAQKNTPAALTLYYNPDNPAEVTEKANARWKRVSSALARAVPQQNGTFEAQARVGSGFWSKTISVRGDFLAKLSPGSTFPVWANPLNLAEFSLEPRSTIGGKKYPLLFLAIALGAAAIGLVIHKPKEWLAPPAPSAPPVLAGTTKDALRRIDWYQFEKVSARLLEIDGWSVTRRGGANPDGGADLVAQREGRSAVVQCKHWKNWEIPPKVMRELLGTRVSAGLMADSAMLFTLNGCTAEALRFAGGNGITVYDADRIAAMVDAAGISRFPEITHPDDKRCPKCDAPMVLRSSARGEFWGCSRYGPDRCRGRIDAEPDTV